jgi:hypothetical protein
MTETETARSRRYGYAGREVGRCVCHHGNCAHHLHAKPKNRAGDHVNPKCKHSDLRRTMASKPPKEKAVRRKLPKVVRP